MRRRAWIGLGSNLGDRRATLDAAVAGLAATDGVVVQLVSTYHETTPVGGPLGQGPFLNAAARLETTLDPHRLLAALQRIEAEAGRVRLARWGERTLDLDLLLYDHQVIDSNALQVPHPRLAVRRFVLAPLAEIAPNFVAPIVRKSIANLLARLDRKPRLLAIDGSGAGPKPTIFRRLVEELPAFGVSEVDLDPADAIATDPHRAVLDRLRRKAEALKASRWETETLRVPWIVADYCLEADLVRASSRDPMLDRQRVAAGLAGLALPPTFVLVLADALNPVHPPGIRSPTLVRPQSDDPDAIVAEAFVTCRGIEGA